MALISEAKAQILAHTQAFLAGGAASVSHRAAVVFESSTICLKLGIAHSVQLLLQSLPQPSLTFHVFEAGPLLEPSYSITQQCCLVSPWTHRKVPGWWWAARPASPPAPWEASILHAQPYSLGTFTTTP